MPHPRGGNSTDWGSPRCHARDRHMSLHFHERATQKPMWETCSVQLNVRLPKDVARQAEEVQRTDPEFLSRVILYGLTRRSVYRHLREQGQASRRSGDLLGESAHLPL